MKPSRPQAEIDSTPFHYYKFDDGTIWTEFYRSAESYLLRFPGLADFEVSSSGDEVTAYPAEGGDDSDAACYDGTWFAGPRPTPEAKRLPADGAEAGRIKERARRGQARVESFDGGLEVIDETGHTLAVLRAALSDEFHALSTEVPSPEGLFFGCTYQSFAKTAPL